MDLGVDSEHREWAGTATEVARLNWQFRKRRLPHWLRHRWGKWLTALEPSSSDPSEYQRRECETCGRSQIRAS